MTNTKKSYSELVKLSSFLDRFNYLKIDGAVGVATFGFDRYLNQEFYRSKEWKRLRNQIIIRDNGCDLGIQGHEIMDHAIIHHINPLREEDLVNGSDLLFDPENLITVSMRTHQAIHYGDSSLLDHFKIIERRPGDTCPWK